MRKKNTQKIYNHKMQLYQTFLMLILYSIFEVTNKLEIFQIKTNQVLN
jgi:hypothetical protein